jgi:hypothetical protein
MMKSEALLVIVALFSALAIALFFRATDPVAMPVVFTPKPVIVKPLEYQRYPDPIDGGWVKPWERVDGTWRTKKQKPKCVDAPWFRRMPECRP